MAHLSIKAPRTEHNSAPWQVAVATHLRATTDVSNRWLAQRLLGWPADVEDVVQEVFVAAWRNLKKFRRQSSPKTWLMRITINECRSQNRKRILRLAFLRRFAGEKAREHAPESNESDQRLTQVREAVRRLPGCYREVVVLRYLEQLDMTEIMQVLGLSRSAVDARLHRAREMLKRDLQVTR